MVALLQKAFEEAAKLPPDQQAILAEWILEELADEQRWAAAFAQSLEVLEQLGKAALAEFEAGLTEELDPDTL